MEQRKVELKAIGPKGCGFAYMKKNQLSNNLAKFLETKGFTVQKQLALEQGYPNFEIWDEATNKLLATSDISSQVYNEHMNTGHNEEEFNNFILNQLSSN